MRFDANSNYLNKKFVELGLALPVEDVDDLQFTEEEELIIFRDQFMITKDDVVKEILLRTVDSSILAEEAEFNKVDEKTLAYMYSTLCDRVQDSMLFDAPEGFWHYEFKYCDGVLLLVLVNETGYIDDCLNYIPDELHEEFVMFKVNENGEADLI